MQGKKHRKNSLEIKESGILSRGRDALKSEDWWESCWWDSKFDATFKDFLSLDLQKDTCFLKLCFHHVNNVAQENFFTKMCKQYRSWCSMCQKLWENFHTCIFKGIVKVIERLIVFSLTDAYPYYKESLQEIRNLSFSDRGSAFKIVLACFIRR